MTEAKYSNKEPTVEKDAAGMTIISFPIAGGTGVECIAITPHGHTRLFDKLRVTLPGHEEPESAEVVSFNQAS